MKRLVIVMIALCAVPAAAQDGPRGSGAGRGSPRGYANPSAVIAAELAMARDAQTRGTATALAAAAANDAVVFAPQLTWARPWLKRRADPAPARRWEPLALWSSCDGSVVVSHGVWSAAGGKGGWVVRVWQREATGGYKWAAMLESPAASVPAEPDMISAQVADCPARTRAGNDESGGGGKRRKPGKPVKPKDVAPLDPRRHGGAAGDGSLRWEVRVEPGGAERLIATWRKDGVDRPVLDERVVP